MKKRKLLFISAYTASFVKNDLNFLQKHFSVRELIFSGGKNPLEIIKTVFLIFREILRNEIVYCWFADFRAFVAVFLAKLFGKKSIIIIGGYEVANVPEINYGGFLNKKISGRLKYILKNANKIFSVSEASRKELLAVFPTLKPQLIYNGVDCQRFFPKGKKEKIVLTVGNVQHGNLKRKGLETFVKTATFLPDFKFILVGKFMDDSIEYLRSIAAENVEFTGFVEFEKLSEFYQKAKVYVQVSAHEAFGLSLAEAMLCECVPVVTRRGAIPEVAGENGFYVDFDNPQKTAAAILQAMNSEKGKEARQHILKNFCLKEREEKIVKAINEIL